ncbi:MAG: geranylgeranyl diphosphate reductase [Pseudomonadota bacterium]
MTRSQGEIEQFDVAVIGGGPAGATAATELAKQGRRVWLLDRPGRIKPCGGAIPPRLIKDFEIPDHLIVARANCARVVAPSTAEVDMPIDGGYVGMVDREVFDEWLRERAEATGATRAAGSFDHLEQDGEEVIVRFRSHGNDRSGPLSQIRARVVIGADGANSAVAKARVRGSEKGGFVAAYHEIVKAPAADPDYDGSRCDIYYRGDLSPDFYSWIFPHGDVLSVGTGTARKGFSIRQSVTDLRRLTGLQGETVRREGAPIPLKPLPRWDDGKNVVLAGDAAGVVAPASGEGIYYAMVGGQLAAEAAHSCLATGNPKALRRARRQFMRAHGRVFWILGIMQRFWYTTDKRRERFVTMCADPDVQYLTWQAYMHKELVRARPKAHVKIFFRDLGHLIGIGRTRDAEDKIEDREARTAAG